jgi:hypothetical protein
MLPSVSAGEVCQMSLRKAGKCRSADTRSRTLTTGLSGPREGVGFFAEIFVKNDDNQFIGFNHGTFGAEVRKWPFWQIALAMGGRDRPLRALCLVRIRGASG